MQHKNTALVGTLLLILLALGCRPEPNPLPVAASPTPAPAATSAPTATPPTHTPFSAVDIGAYRLTNWRSIGQSNINWYGYVTIARGDEVLLTIADAYEISPLPQGDINGDGAPDVMIHRRTGGSHCCVHTTLYSLAAAPIAVLSVSQSINSDGGRLEPRDLDGDGVLELLTHDSLDNERRFCTPPIVPVVLALNDAGAYEPAGARFLDYYDAAIAQQIDRLAEGPAGADYRRCPALALAGLYYYSGRPAEGDAALRQWLPDNPELYGPLVELIQAGRFYAA